MNSSEVKAREILSIMGAVVRLTVTAITAVCEGLR